MTKRPTLRNNLPAAARQEVVEGAAAAQAITASRQAEVAPVADGAGDDRGPMTTSSIHIPLELLDALRAAANRRAARKVRERGPKVRGISQESSRPSVSEIVVELLTLHRDEIDKLD
jgi:hypothetical protein